LEGELVDAAGLSVGGVEELLHGVGREEVGVDAWACSRSARAALRHATR
jgi:hypothetical protein